MFNPFGFHCLGILILICEVYLQASPIRSVPFLSYLAISFAAVAVPHYPPGSRLCPSRLRFPLNSRPLLHPLPWRRRPFRLDVETVRDAEKLDNTISHSKVLNHVYSASREHNVPWKGLSTGFLSSSASLTCSCVPTLLP